MTMRRIRPYLASAFIIALSTLARYVMEPWIGLHFPLLTYLPAVEIIAYFYGFRPAMISIGASVVLGRLLFIEPLHPLLFPPPEAVIMVCLYVLFSASLSMFMENLRAARAEAEANASLAQEHLERLEAEMAGRQRERDWSDSVLTSIADGVIATDGAGNVTYMNPLAEQLTGWTKAEAAQQPVSRVFYTIEELPYKLLSSTDGQMIPVEYSTSVIKGDDGQELGKVIVFRDVTERRKAQEALLASETRLHASLLAAGAAAWEWNLRTNEIICSAEFRELTGLRDSDTYLHFSTLLEAIHEHDRLPLQDELTSAARRGDEFRLEYRLVKDGEVRWLGLMGRLAAPDRMVGIVVDLTDRRRLEERLRDAAKQESLGVLSAGIAHDFNNLLTSILGYASLLRNEFPPESRVASYAAGIEESSKRAAHLTRQILAYSGQGRFSLEQINLTTRVRKTVEDLRISIGSQIVLELNLAADLPLVEADPHQLDQVTSGTLTNALEAIGHNPGRVQISTFSQYVDAQDSSMEGIPPGNYVVFEVRDTGCGMDEATRNRIFDPFFTTKFTGRGLGLAAVLGIMRGHGGAIHVESTPGVGSIFQIFWLALPAKMAHGA
jgi:signal transduction histidine kinase